LHNDLITSPLVEANRIPGVGYASTNDGIELPIVDVTNPAFALIVTGTEQGALVEKFLQEKGPFASLPTLLRNWLQSFLLLPGPMSQFSTFVRWEEQQPVRVAWKFSVA